MPHHSLASCSGFQRSGNGRLTKGPSREHKFRHDSYAYHRTAIAHQLHPKAEASKPAAPTCDSTLQPKPFHSHSSKPKPPNSRPRGWGLGSQGTTVPHSHLPQLSLESRSVRVPRGPTRRASNRGVAERRGLGVLG